MLSAFDKLKNEVNEQKKLLLSEIEERKKSIERLETQLAETNALLFYLNEKFQIIKTRLTAVENKNGIKIDENDNM